MTATTATSRTPFPGYEPEQTATVPIPDATVFRGSAADQDATLRTPKKAARPAPAAEATDAAFLAAALLFALSGLRGTFADSAFLAAGLVGLVTGLGAAHVAGRLTRNPLAVALLAAVGYFVFGPVVLSQGSMPLPTPSALHTLASAAVHGWKQLLTTRPPVGDDPALLAIPFLLALAGAAAGHALASRLRAPGAPLPAALAVLALVLALGTDQPTAWPVTSVFFAVLLMLWTALRSRRTRAAISSRSARIPRLVIGVGSVLVAAAVASAVAPWLPGAGGAGRTVLRDKVAPPLDLAEYPSPLVGFHKYTKDAHQLYDQQLMTVSGLPSGAAIDIAVLDDYDGSVWGAVNPALGDSFERVGPALRPAQGGAGGPAVIVRITIGPAYADAADLDDWLPSAGTVTGITLSGAVGKDGKRAADLSGSLWYNSATASAIVTDRLQAGDTVTLRTTLDQATLPADAQPYAPPTVTNGYQALFAARAAAWDKGAVGLTAQLKAIADYLKQNGAYSDGGPGESQYLPGHSIGRLTAFLNGAQPVGDDEQYATAYALLATSLGIPARVVFGAIPEADGVVKGADVHAWVEVRVTSGAWVRIPGDQFMPPVSKAPAPIPPQTTQNQPASVVPPPDPKHPPTGFDPVGANTSTGHGPTGDPSPPPPSWLGPLLVVLGWVGVPVLAVGFVAGLIRAGKAQRRRRRRTRGTPAARFAAGWADLVDHARDLGMTVPAGTTRLQQARSLADHDLRRLARAADAAIYGPGDPTADLVGNFWREVDAGRRRLSAAASRRRRVRAAFNLATFVPSVPGRGGQR